MADTFLMLGRRSGGATLNQLRHIMGAVAPKVKGVGIARAKSRPHKEFADRLRAAMVKRGWGERGGATRLAEALGGRTAPQLVASWLRGERIPRGPTAVRLAAVLGVEDAEIWGTGADAPKVPGSATGRAAGKRSIGKGALVEGPESAHYEQSEGSEEPGWGFGDPSEAEELARTSLRHIERTHRAMVSDPAGFSADDVRQIQLASARGFMRQYELSAKPVPDWLHRIYNEIIAGTFR